MRVHLRSWLAGLLAAACVLAGGQAASARVPLPEPRPVPAVPHLPEERPARAPQITIDMAKFAAWRRAFRKQALKDGIKAHVFDTALGKVEPDMRVLQANQHQPETTRTVWDYLDTAISDKRLTTGSNLLVANRDLLDRLQKQYGVPGKYLVSIWGMESNYGTITGSYNVFQSLATLAYEGRRTDFAERELIAALKIVQRGDEPADKMIGSWAGALGQTQFIPTAYLKYAVDEDGDGRCDLFNSVPDILASIANFLSKSGWQRGEPWGEEVKLPQGFNYALADPTVQMPMSRWHNLGVATLSGAPVQASAEKAALYLPAGYRGPAFVTLPNFRTFLRYNNSTVYALAVGELGDRLAGAPPIRAAWPVDERPLTLSERIELQTLLDKLGFDVGEPDGIIGSGTREGVRRYQKKVGLPPDGFATVALLDRLRADAAGVPSASSSKAAPD